LICLPIRQNILHRLHWEPCCSVILRADLHSKIYFPAKALTVSAILGILFTAGAFLTSNYISVGL
jgi:hypothetical protein